MSFKLRVIKNDQRIDLRPGEHVFGRNRHLPCSDKQISRKHGLLTVNKTSVILKALYHNPCYYKKMDSKEIEPLRQNESVTLYGGDRFALLMDSSWFELLYVPCDEAEQETEEENHKIIKKEAENVTGEGENNDKIDSSGATVDCENSNDQPKKKNQDEPSTPENTSSVKDGNNLIGKIPENSNESTEVFQQNENNVNPQLKRSNNADGSDETKKIKLEPEVTQEQDVMPGSSNQADVSNDNNAAALPPGPPRERCMYGASCYRKNLQHHAQFSHPLDPDWGPGDRGVCPYGAACRKTDPRHWRDHEHPPGKLPPQRQGMQVVQRHGDIFYINANTVHFYEEHFEVEENSGDSADYDYEF